MTTANINLGARGQNLSILIPTYNCADYLRLTLASLRKQTTSIADAEIIVVDDASTQDDPATAAEQSWPGHVDFHRHPQNIGLVANFNSCLQMAERPWLHILHGDDIALPGTYEEFDRTISAAPSAAAIFGRSVFLNDRGFWKGTTPILGDEDRGLLAYRPIDWLTSPVQFAGVLLNRRQVLDLGGFDSHFTHAADWNLWWRIARTGRAAYTNQCVGGYRMFEGNHSSTLRRSGHNLREGIDQINRVITDIPPGQSPRQIWTPMVDSITRQCRSFANDPQALAANLALFDLLPPAAVPWRIKSELRRTIRQAA